MKKIDTIPTITGLSRERINSVVITDNSEPLTDIPFSLKLTFQSNEFLDPRLRSTVTNMLSSASELLPDGYRLCVLTAYRDIGMQQKLWDMKSQIVKKKFWFLPQYFRDKITRKYCALPTGNGPHQSGGAVDVTIMDPQGELLDMGTSFPAYGEICHTAYQNLTDSQKSNRLMLYETMIHAGFTNYPLEWWHYCYGERMWAAYNGLQECCYGAIAE